jgi:hypothetical protein
VQRWNNFLVWLVQLHAMKGFSSEDDRIVSLGVANELLVYLQAYTPATCLPQRSFSFLIREF